MATIRKRGTKWQVQLRRQGFPPLSRSFHRKSDACEWARCWEARADRNDLPSNTKILNSMSLGDLVRRYRDERASTKKGAAIERCTLSAFLRDPICRKKLSHVATEDFAEYRDRRLGEISSKSLARQLSPLSNMFNVARREWGLPVGNPIENLRLCQTDKRRQRRLREGELGRLVSASGKTRNIYILPLFLFAIETGMRRGEILAMEWDQVDLERRSVVIPVAKNGHSRTIPLTLEARDILLGLDRSGSKVFPITPVALRLAWDRLTVRAGLPDLHFHDLRHEAISRFFELGLTVPEVASISGHRDIRMLMRYAHADPSRLLTKLDLIERRSV